MFVGAAWQRGRMRETPDEIATLQRLIDASFATASSHLRGIMEPERRLYKASKQPTSEVAIRRRVNEDFYLNFAGMSNDNTKAVIQAYIFPLVTCIWMGYWVLFIGTLVCMIPPKVKLAYARTEVVGVARKHVPVER